MCKTLEVSRSGFYAWLGRSESDRAREDRGLTALIRGIFAESRKTYWAPRTHRTLQERGVRCSQKRVARLMKAYKTLVARLACKAVTHTTCYAICAVVR